eukprot:m.251937 g.251937  ORF g.251937 m.251937 type:complete len:53 (+) comp15905_c0_seq20:2400-2558(+)
MKSGLTDEGASQVQRHYSVHGGGNLASGRRSGGPCASGLGHNGGAPDQEPLS